MESHRKTRREEHGMGHCFSLDTVGDSELAFLDAQVVGSLVIQWTLRECQGRSAGWSSPPCRGRVQAAESPGLGVGFGQLMLSSAKLKPLMQCERKH